MSRLPSDHFAYRFVGLLDITASGRCTLELSSDDGARLWLDDELAIDHWGHHRLSAKATTLTLARGLHRVRIDYYELDGWAGVKLRFAPVGKPLSFDAPARRLPLAVKGVELFGVQTDRSGNRSGFGALGAGYDRATRGALQPKGN